VYSHDPRYRAVYDGRATNDEEIAGFLIATLFAGQHTSSISSSWTGYQMLDTKVSILRLPVHTLLRLILIQKRGACPHRLQGLPIHLTCFALSSDSAATHNLWPVK